MIKHSEICDKYLKQNIKTLCVQFAGNKNLKIYGTLKCKFGKRMKRSNRVFFKSENEAIDEGYRPCGNCMKKKYKTWISLRK